jgi:hypothetical protein
MLSYSPFVHNIKLIADSETKAFVHLEDTSLNPILLSRPFLVAGFMAFLLPAVRAAGDPKASDSVVKATASAEKAKADGKQVITVTLTIDKDWHIYANPVGNEDLADNQTTLQFSAKTKPEVVQIDYPKGKLVKDPVVGNFAVYEGKTVIKATVKRAKDATGRLELSIKVSACSDVNNVCLMPATIKVSVKE